MKLFGSTFWLKLLPYLHENILKKYKEKAKNPNGWLTVFEHQLRLEGAQQCSHECIQNLFTIFTQN